VVVVLEDVLLLVAEPDVHGSHEADEVPSTGLLVVVVLLLLELDVHGSHEADVGSTCLVVVVVLLLLLLLLLELQPSQPSAAARPATVARAAIEYFMLFV